ncbi:glycosyltransferase involved in cell wall biosynthesis [Caldalkalibacillus uzonensis]|uniref:Glycosyltransferase involved in cell wall biosynthesis n=1 Tax=Caldalkalibacillus uzonensis TaxID=353224 RepID=A0ABU0CSD1_9BACI|nr:glycosyltransferase family 2 protein [Caldalkalibacillus uzonensis]MDQ0339003.1 glycosyltransferase involved in cell wall biosynthesis [Caldalkalibacillus uzonensis]
MADEALFTVVIPVYNREKMIRKAIKSVIRQTYPYWKLLIIDDASTDRTIQRIRPFQNDKRIQVISLKENVGLAKVLNIALEQVDTPYFVQLDSDDWLEPCTLEELAKAIKKADPQTALFYGNCKFRRKKNGKWKVTKYIRHRSFTDKYDFLQYLTYSPVPRCFRTEALRETGGWETDDPYEGRIMSDRRICLKLIERYPFYWIDQYLYNCRRHRDRLTNKDSKEQRNELRKMVIEYYLKKWGNHYRPVYTKKYGYLKIKRLEKVE